MLVRNILFIPDPELWVLERAVVPYDIVFQGVVAPSILLLDIQVPYALTLKVKPSFHQFNKIHCREYPCSLWPPSPAP